MKEFPANHSVKQRDNAQKNRRTMEENSKRGCLKRKLEGNPETAKYSNGFCFILNETPEVFFKDYSQSDFVGHK